MGSPRLVRTVAWPPIMVPAVNCNSWIAMDASSSPPRPSKIVTLANQQSFRVALQKKITCREDHTVSGGNKIMLLLCTWCREGVRMP